MAREIPEAVRAAAGLAATVLDEVRRLPGELTHLPVRLLGLAMQTSLKLQQQYSGLVARGDEVFTGLWGSAEPGMATFDEDLPQPVTPTANRTSAFDLVDEPEAVAEGEVLAAAAPIGEEELSEALVEAALAEELGSDSADLTVELSDEIADIAGTGDLPAVGDDAPLADVLAFETLAGEVDGISDAQAAALPADPPADTVTEVVDELAGEVDAELAAELPESVPDEVADDLAADTVATVADAEVADGAAAAGRAADGGSPGSTPDEGTVRDLGLVGTADAIDPDTDIPDIALPAPPAEPATSDDDGDTAPEDATDTAEPAAAEDGADEAQADEGEADGGEADGGEADGGEADGGEVAGDLAAVEGIVVGDGSAAGPPTAESPTVEGVPALGDTAEDTADEAPAETTPEEVAPADTTPEETAPADTATEDTATEDTAPTAPVEGYDAFSIPALRGHLRGYPTETVADLLDYERATRARAPYITMLQNRLEKLNADRG